MKKTIKRVIALALAATTVLTVGALSASAVSAPKVRTNGYVVDFPDAQPFIDSNDRTLIPVRFVSEQMGAEVSWDNKAQTATIAKNGVSVDVKIGSPEIKVTKDGKTNTTKMDTAAVLKDNRTYVPIRYVAEALGATVDYSDVYQTVGIYNDKLTAEQTRMLQALPYTRPEHTMSYAEAKVNYDADRVAFLYGTDRDMFDVWANAREHLYNTIGDDEFFANVVAAAVKGVDYKSERVTIKMVTDQSCIYQADCMDRLLCSVRGIAQVQLNVKPTELTGEETAMLCRLGFTQLYTGKMMQIPVDIHMNARVDDAISVHSVVAAGAAF